MNEVRETIAAELRREFETFYPEPQRELWKERNRLFESIESKLAPLIQRIEEVVGEKLHISLNLVPIEVQNRPLTNSVSTFEKGRRILFRRKRRGNLTWLPRK